MQHILLTGATGFLGSHLLGALLGKGYRVTILKRSYSDTWRIDHMLSQVRAFDVDQVSIEEAFKDQKIDYVIHTACSYGRKGQSSNVVTETNLLFALKVFDAATLFGTQTFVNTDTLLPKYLNAYSLSKKQFTEWLEQGSKNIQVINLKLEHMFGPTDDETKFVPWLISQFNKNLERIPLTEGRQLRDFIFIDDVVSAYLVALEKVSLLPQYSNFEVGTGKLTSVQEFVTQLYQAHNSINPNSRTQLGFGDIPMRDGELMSVTVDNTSLKQLGWQARTNLQDGINKLFKVKK